MMYRFINTLMIATCIMLVIIETSAFTTPRYDRAFTTTSNNKVSIAQTTTTPATTTTKVTDSSLKVLLQAVELPEKLYIPKEKEIPKVLGGLKIGLRKLVVITGASSGLGLNTAIILAKSGRYFIVMACRDVEKGKRGNVHEYLTCFRSGNHHLLCVRCLVNLVSNLQLHIL
jgi:hypothetical protein